MGYHLRTDYNKPILKIGKKRRGNHSGGVSKYGLLKNNYLLLKGSVVGPKKRAVPLMKPIRPNLSITKRSAANNLCLGEIIKMKLPLLNMQNKKTGDLVLPSQFSEGFRPDLIKRAVHSPKSKARLKRWRRPRSRITAFI